MLYEHAVPYDQPLPRQRLGRLASRVLFFETVESTNDIAASLVAGDPGGSQSIEGVVVVADAQTAGRGRRGHSWFSPAGAGLYVSVILTPGLAADPARATALLTIAAGVALADAIAASTGLPVDLKWPNDLYVSRRKLGGILAEASATGTSIDAVVLGYGINIGPAAFPPELADRATSLESELGRSVDRHDVFVETLASLGARYDDLLAGRFDGILDAWRRRSPSARGARVQWTTPSGPASGVTVGIDDDARLLVRTEKQIERIGAGEISWDV
jgi:BirA family biotin operon repressor/biotin-[acetyl-CoA-carboxylase] ligase